MSPEYSVSSILHSRHPIYHANLYFVVKNLADIEYAGYGGLSEATGRVSIDVVLIQCIIHLRQRHEHANRQPSTPTAGSEPPKKPTTPPNHPPIITDHPITPTNPPVTLTNPATPTELVTTFPKRCLMFAEPTLSVQLRSPDGQEFLFSGYADWAFGYDQQEDVLLVAIEASRIFKRRDSTSCNITSSTHDGLVGWKNQHGCLRFFFRRNIVQIYV